MSILQILAVAVGIIGVPGWFIYSLWRSREEDRFRWFLRSLYTGALILFLFVAAPWDWASYYLRYVWVTLYAGAVYASFRRVRHQSFAFKNDGRTWTDLVSLAIFAALVAYAATGFRYAEEPVRLTFPLRDGTYYVGQGGNSAIINYHNTYAPQRYALDIVALNAVGRRSTGIYPSDPNAYVIFGENLYSPCDGIATRVRDGLPDQRPPDADQDHPPGNHVVVRCEGVNVVLAHMQKGSIVVREGDPVSSGDPIGKVGNSGNTSEPHLHIHAVRSEEPGDVDGVGVPILFDGRFLVRNTLVR